MTAPDILLIEDNRHDSAMIMDALHEHDMRYRVFLLNDGAKALGYFADVQGNTDEAHPPFPRLILLDLKLPKVDGIELIERLKSNERTRHIPIVVFTSSNEPRDKMKSFALGANSYVIKPLDGDSFANTVSSIVSYWLRTNAPIHDDLGGVRAEGFPREMR